MGVRLRLAMTGAATAAAVLTMGMQEAAPSRPAVAATPAPTPPQYYLSAGPNAFAILPPAPVKGSIRYEADRQMFLATRARSRPRIRTAGRWRSTTTPPPA